MRLYPIILISVSKETGMTINADPFLLTSPRTREQMAESAEHELYKRYPTSTHHKQSLMVQDITGAMPQLGIQWIGDNE